jgi:DNA-binding PadR family transcriptional regulator
MKEKLEHIVMAAVASIEEPYGLTIHAKVEKFTGSPLRFGPMYSALNRLENRGYLTSVTEVRDGRPKRIYSITDAGQQALETTALTADETFEMLPTRLGEKIWAGERSG